MLIVDDAEAVRVMLAGHLRALSPGVHIEEESTAAGGVERALAGDFHLVFLDGVFSDGTSSTATLSAILTRRPHARVVLTTSRPREHPDVAEALGLGAYAYLQKPLRRNAVEEILQRLDTDEGRVGHIR